MPAPQIVNPNQDARPLPVRARCDLTFRPRTQHDHPRWIVKEPLGLRYFDLSEPEYEILKQLDGRRSLAQIHQHLSQRFPGCSFTPKAILRFVQKLQRAGLLISAAPEQSCTASCRAPLVRRPRWLQASNLLAIRFKGFDPDRFLDRTYPYVHWFFTQAALVYVLLMALAACLLVTVHFDRFRGSLAGLHEFFGPGDVLLLALTLAVTKMLHELGHAYACKHFGGECHEIGMMLFFFMPCLYCNVSDSWMLSSKWKRAAIGAAGMYVEITLASAATLVWWCSEPGVLNASCLRVMLICSVSTILFNSNPLSRYDGYYILSDMIDIPNLRQRASACLYECFARLCLGIDPAGDSSQSRKTRVFLVIYGILAIAYRWLIVLSISWLLYRVLKPHGLEAAAYLLTSLAVGRLLLQPAGRFLRYCRTQMRTAKMKRTRPVVFLATTVSAALAVFLLPLPSHVHCPAESHPEGATAVYVDVPGQLVERTKNVGQEVGQDQLLARLTNLDLELEVETLRGNQRELAARLEKLHRMRTYDPTAAEQIPQAEKMLAAIDQQLTDRRRDLERLQIKAPTAGTLLPPPARRLKNDADGGRLHAWQGRPLDERNLLASLEQGVLLCRIGDPQAWEFLLWIEQGDVPRVQVGQRAKVLLDSHPGQVFSGRITEISSDKVHLLPASMAIQSGGGVASRTAGSERGQPVHPVYTARVKLDTAGHSLQAGLRGRAKIHTGSETIALRVWRTFAETFHFSL